MKRLLAAALLAATAAAQAASDAEVRDWVSELVGAQLALEELAGGACSGLTPIERLQSEALYTWGSALASREARAHAEARKAQALAIGRFTMRQWLANELAGPRPLGEACMIYTGIFRTIRDAAESELEDIEYQLKGRVTPRGER